MRTAHVRTAKCPGCRKLRRLDHVWLVPTRQDDPRRSVWEKPKYNAKPQRVCVDCHRSASEAA